MNINVIKEGTILFNGALNTFCLRLYGIRHMVKDHSDSERKPAAGYIGYSFRLAARVLLYASSHRQDNTYHSLCYASRRALAGTRNSSMGPLNINSRSTALHCLSGPNDKMKTNHTCNCKDPFYFTQV